MTLSTLKRIRIIVPGALFAIVLIPAISGGLDETIKALQSFDIGKGLYLLVVPVLGGIYYALKVRMLVYRPELLKVNQNIKDTLTAPFVGTTMSPSQAESIKESTAFMGLYFYYFVDKDESLKEKASNVRANGAIWTSAADAVVIFGFAAILYVFLGIAMSELDFVISAVLATLLGGFSFLLLKRLTQQHLALSNEQLELILADYRGELQTRFQKAVSELPE